MREIECLSLVITTKCNRNCPECCCNIPNINQENYSWEYIVNASSFFKGIKRLNITGGEPTIHPNFVEWTTKFRELFQCQYLTLESNGWGFKLYPEYIWSYYNWIQVSHYTKDSYTGSSDNSADVDYLSNIVEKSKYLVGEIKHTPRNIIGKGRVCLRGVSETVIYQDGLLYPCCVAPGVPDSIGIPPTENWREDILHIQQPCKRCWFSV